MRETFLEKLGNLCAMDDLITVLALSTNELQKTLVADHDNHADSLGLDELDHFALVSCLHKIMGLLSEYSDDVDPVDLSVYVAPSATSL